MISLSLIASIIGFVIAIVVHESAHAIAADRLGDPTAKYAGRVTLNPLRHIDPIGTVLVPMLLILSNTGFVFGWAKPVPVNPYNFRNPLKDKLLVALAGPVANFFTALIFSVFLKYVPTGSNIPMLLTSIITINLVLMMFNLIPIPPLDGSAILPFIFRGNASFLYWVENQSFTIIIIFLLLDSITGGAILNLIVRQPVMYLLAWLIR